MAAGIYLRRNGKLVRLTQQVYATEADLRQRIAVHPRVVI